MRNFMLDISASGTFDVDGSSEIGISYSAVPTVRGPRYLGKAGTGLSVANILAKCRVSRVGELTLRYATFMERKRTFSENK